MARKRVSVRKKNGITLKRKLDVLPVFKNSQRTLLLMLIALNEPIKARTLYEEMGISPVTLYKQLNSAIKDGLICRYGRRFLKRGTAYGLNPMSGVVNELRAYFCAAGREVGFPKTLKCIDGARRGLVESTCNEPNFMRWFGTKVWQYDRIMMAAILGWVNAVGLTRLSQGMSCNVSRFLRDTPLDQNLYEPCSDVGERPRPYRLRSDFPAREEFKNLAKAIRLLDELVDGHVKVAPEQFQWRSNTDDGREAYPRFYWE